MSKERGVRREGAQGESSKSEEEKDGEGGEGGYREGEGDAEEKDLQRRRRRFEKMNMTKEKAQLILDALKQNELQYIQQLRRRATRPKSKNKPDW